MWICYGYSKFIQRKNTNKQKWNAMTYEGCIFRSKKHPEFLNNQEKSHEVCIPAPIQPGWRLGHYPHHYPFCLFLPPTLHFAGACECLVFPNASERGKCLQSLHFPLNCYSSTSPWMGLTLSFTCRYMGNLSLTVSFGVCLLFIVYVNCLLPISCHERKEQENKYLW